MKLKVWMPIICSMFCVAQSLAQSPKVYFFKKTGAEVKVRDSADFIRVISEPDSGSVFYKVVETYLNGTNQFIGKSSKPDHLVLEDKCTWFFPNGKTRQISNYKQGKKVGTEYNYYPNGKLYTQKQYIVDDANQNLGYYDNYLIEQCNDSTGKALVLDGNGHYIGYGDDFNNVEEVGTVKSGLREGQWTGEIEDKWNKLTFNEVYQNGKMISGHSVDQSAHLYNYTNREIQPQFKGGMDSFYSYLSHHINYPPFSKKHNIVGRVVLNFVIEKDGTIGDVKAIKTPSEDLATEGIRVMKESPKWMPGLRYGRPVRVHFTIPINFSLGN